MSACAWAGAALALWLALSPGRAQAQSDQGWQFHFGAEFYVLGTCAVVGTLAGVGFLVADAVFAAHGSWLPPIAAGLELALAGVPWLVVAALAFSIDGVNAEVGGIAMMTGLAFSVHGVASLALYEPSSPTVEQPAAAQARSGRGWQVAPWITPRRAGASVLARF
jgi:hypothetical protein